MRGSREWETAVAPVVTSDGEDVPGTVAIMVSIRLTFTFETKWIYK